MSTNAILHNAYKSVMYYNMKWRIYFLIILTKKSFYFDDIFLFYWKNQIKITLNQCPILTPDEFPKSPDFVAMGSVVFSLVE